MLAVARQMIDEDHVFALVNFSGPAIGDIVAHARAARVPVLFPHTALVSSEGERYLFTSFPRFEGEAEVMFRYLAEGRAGCGAWRSPTTRTPTVPAFRDRLQAHATRFGYTFAGAVADRHAQAGRPGRGAGDARRHQPRRDRDGAVSGAGAGPDGGARFGRLARPHGLDRAAD